MPASVPSRPPSAPSTRIPSQPSAVLSDGSCGDFFAAVFFAAVFLAGGFFLAAAFFFSAIAALQQLGCGAGGIELAPHNTLQQLGDRGIVRDSGLELAAQAPGRELEHLVAQVA